MNADDGVSTDAAGRVEALRKRAESGDLDACREVFGIYDTGRMPDGSRAPVKKDHAEAVRLYMPCADAGDAEAQETIGYMYLMGKGVPKDRDLAVSLLTKAADSGVARAAYRIAYMYDSGQCFAEPDLGKAVEWYRRASDMGYPEQMYQLAGICFMKEGIWYSPSKGRKLLSAAADAGCPEAEHQLGLMYAYGANGFKRDAVLAREYLLKACEDGVQNAQTEYANMCFEGTILPRDFAEAARWFETASRNYNGNATYALAVMHANGYYYEQDDGKAFELFMDQQESGDPNAQYALACFYYEGRGTEKDPKRASMWFRESAEQGHAGAMAFLGMFLVTGTYIDRNTEEGLALLKKAADAGYCDAQFYLGKIYKEGEYVPKDLEYARKMLLAAREQGDPDAEALLEEIRYEKRTGKRR